MAKKKGNDKKLNVGARFRAGMSAATGSLSTSRMGRSSFWEAVREYREEQKRRQEEAKEKREEQNEKKNERKKTTEKKEVAKANTDAIRFLKDELRQERENRRNDNREMVREVVQQVEAVIENPHGEVSKLRSEMNTRLLKIDYTTAKTYDDTKYIRKKLDKDFKKFENLLSLSLLSGSNSGIGGITIPSKKKIGSSIAGGAGLLWSLKQVSKSGGALKILGNATGVHIPKVVAASPAIIKFTGKLQALAKYGKMTGYMAAIMLPFVEPLVAKLQNAPEEEVKRQVVGAIAETTGALIGLAVGSSIGGTIGAFFFGAGSVPGAIIGAAVGVGLAWKWSDLAEDLAERIYTAIWMDKDVELEIRKWYAERERIIEDRKKQLDAKKKLHPPHVYSPYLPNVHSNQTASGIVVPNRVPAPKPTVPNPSQDFSKWPMPAPVPRKYVKPTSPSPVETPAARRNRNTFKGLLKQPNTPHYWQPASLSNSENQPTVERRKIATFIGSGESIYDRDQYGNFNPTLQGTPKGRLFRGFESAMGSYLVDQTKDQMPSTYGGRFAKGGVPGGGFSPSSGTGRNNGNRKVGSNEKPKLDSRAQAHVDRLVRGETVHNSRYLDAFSDDELEALGITKTFVTSPENPNIRASSYKLGTPRISREDIQAHMSGGMTKTASGKVLTAANSSLSLDQRTFLSTLAIGDTGTSKEFWESPDYNTIVGGRKFSDFSDHPRIFGTPKSTAAGRYQFTKTTWDEVVKKWNAQNPDDPILDFSPRNQDRAAWWLAQDDYRNRTGGRNLEQDLKNLTPQEIAPHIKKALGGSGDRTTWQILQMRSNEQIANALVQNRQRESSTNSKQPNAAAAYASARQRAMENARRKQNEAISGLLLNKGAFPSDVKLAPMAGTAKSPLEGWTNEQLMNVRSDLGETTPGKRRGFMASRAFTGKDKKRLHAGVDYFGNSGDSVFATEDGVVIKASKQSGYNGTIDVLHTDSNGQQYVVRYAHLSPDSFTIREGDRINAGMRLAALDGANHLHMEVRDYEKYKKNPYAKLSVGDNRETAMEKGIYDPVEYFAGTGRFTHLAPKMPANRDIATAPRTSNLAGSALFMGGLNSSLFNTMSGHAKTSKDAGIPTLLTSTTVGYTRAEYEKTAKQLYDNWVANGKKDKIVISGHSYGGVGAMRVAEILKNKHGVQTGVELNLIDPVAYNDWGMKIPSNVDNANIITPDGSWQVLPTMASSQRTNVNRIRVPGDHVNAAFTQGANDAIKTSLGLNERQAQNMAIDRPKQAAQRDQAITPPPAPPVVPPAPPVVTADSATNVRDVSGNSKIPQKNSQRAASKNADMAGFGSNTQEPATTTQARFNQINKNVKADYIKGPAGVPNHPSWDKW